MSDTVGIERQAVKRVYKHLQKEAGDMYPDRICFELAELAVRENATRRTTTRKFRGAIRWLQEKGHL